MLTAAIASGDVSSAAQLLACLEQTGFVKSVKQWSVSGDKVPESAEMLPDVVFLDLPRDPDPYFAFGANLRRLSSAMKLVACSATSPPTPQLLLEAMRSGVQDFLPKPVSSGALREMLSRFVHEIAGRERPSQEKLIVVMGSKGGVGTTTVAVNLGAQLSLFARKRAVLLDFARPLGNVHLLLDLNPSFGVRDAVSNLERLDSHFFAGLLTHHKTNLEILGGAMQSEEWDAIPIAPLERVVNVAQSSFDYVLADLGSQFSSEWRPVLQMAKMIIVVAESSVPALWTLERRLLALKGMGIEPSRTRIVINRWHKGDEKTLKTIEKDGNYSVFSCLPNDYRKVSEAGNLGTPLLENHNNVLHSRYRQLAAHVAGIELDTVSKKGPLGLFSFSREVA
jgi:pilus assembly protein CpaE